MDVVHAIVPASSFSAGPPIRVCRELTAAEERHFERRRRQATATFVGVVLLVPLLGGFLLYASMGLSLTRHVTATATVSAGEPHIVSLTARVAAELP